MREIVLFFNRFRVSLLGSVALVVFADTSNAREISVPSGTVESRQQSVEGDDTLIVERDGVLSVDDTAIRWNGPSTDLEIINKGIIESIEEDGRAFNAGGDATEPRVITLTNEAGAIIRSDNDAIRINVDITDGSVKLVNAGTIVSMRGGQAIDFDEISSTVAGQIEIRNEAGGIIRAEDADAIRPGANGSVINAGIIHADTLDGGSSDGVDFQAHPGSVHNLSGGLITGARHGITSDTDVFVINEEGGQIIGRNGSGVGSDGTGIVYNYGLIRGEYVGHGNGDGDGVDIDDIAYIENWGTIAATGAGGTGNDGFPNTSEAIAIGGGTLINHVGGVIESPGGVVIGDLSAHIENDGIIQGDLYAISTNSSTTIINRGTLEGGASGAIYAHGDTDDTIVAAGAFISPAERAVFMGGGDDIFYVEEGASFNGSIDGGTGNDRFVLDDGAVVSVSVVNFETLEARSGQSSFLSNTDFQDTVVRSSATLTMGAPVAISGTGTSLTIETGGTLNVESDIIFGDGSVYAVAVDADGAHGAVIASGTAHLDGGAVSVIAAPGDYRRRTEYTILTAGSIEGTFAEPATVNLPFLDPSLTYGANDIVLRLVRNDLSFASVGITRNQIAVGAALDSLDRRADLVRAVAGQTEVAGAVTAFDALSGELWGSTGSVLVERSRRAGELVLGRLRQAAGYERLFVDQEGPAASEGRHGLAIWGQVTGVWNRSDGNSNAAGLRESSKGFATGIDMALGEWRVGAAFIHDKADLTVPVRSSSADTRSNGVSLYAGGSLSGVRVSLGGSYQWHDISGRRSIYFPGFAEDVTGRTDGSSLTGFGELAYAATIGPVWIEPFAGVNHVHLKADGFVEANGTSGQLTVGKVKRDVTFTTLGLRLGSDVATSGKAVISPYVSGGWQHGFGDVAGTSINRFATGDAFMIQGVPVARNALDLKAGLEVNVLGAGAIGLSYVGNFSSRWSDNGVRLALSARF